MNVSNFYHTLSFKGATININAFSDTHGQIEHVGRAYQAMLDNDCFEKEEKGKANYLIVGGDWFISGDKKGFLSDPNKELAMFQLDMFNNFIGKLKQISPKLNTIFAFGNHEFDGGEDIVKKISDDIDANIVATNLDFDNSSKLEDEINDGKIVKSSITFVDDDKDINKKHAVLNLACMPVNMQYYAGEPKDINIIENKFISQKKLKTEDYTKSLTQVKEEIEKFKNKYKDGIVILTCHTGAGFAQDCAQIDGIDLIFDGHMHDDKIEYINNTPIISLSQNFNKIANAKLKINDDGLLEKMKISTIRPFNNNYSPCELDEDYNSLFEADRNEIYQIVSDNPNLKELTINNVREGNNYLANFVTDAILSQIRKYDKDVDIFALNASSFRAGFNLHEGKNVTQFDVLNCLNGIQRKQADIYVNEINGAQLLDMVIDNLLFNQTAPKQNPLFQYSGLIIKKDELLRAYMDNEDNLYKYIIFEKTGKPIEKDMTYKIANAKKYFLKAQNQEIKDLFNEATPLNKNILDLFNDYFKENEYIKYSPKERIISELIVNRS